MGTIHGEVIAMANDVKNGATGEQMTSWLIEADKELRLLMAEGSRKTNGSIPFDAAILALAAIIMRHAPDRNAAVAVAQHLHKFVEESIIASGLDEKWRID